MGDKEKAMIKLRLMNEEKIDTIIDRINDMKFKLHVFGSKINVQSEKDYTESLSRSKEVKFGDEIVKLKNLNSKNITIDLPNKKNEMKPWMKLIPIQQIQQDSNPTSNQRLVLSKVSTKTSNNSIEQS